MEKICFNDGIIPYESSLKTTMHSFLILTVAISGFNVGLTAYGLFGPDANKYDAYTGELLSTSQNLVPENSIKCSLSYHIIFFFSPYFPVPVPDTLHGFEAFKAFMLMVVAINSNVAMLSLTFYVVICYSLHKEFEYLCRTFK